MMINMDVGNWNTTYPANHRTYHGPLFYLLHLPASIKPFIDAHPHQNLIGHTIHSLLCGVAESAFDD